MDRSANSDTTTLSPPPFSPFSSGHSTIGSEGGTSDEPADLGHFASVFRALNELQNPIWHTNTNHLSRPRTPTSSTAVNASGDELDIYGNSTVWNHEPIADYLSSDPELDPDHVFVQEQPASDTEGEDGLDAGLELSNDDDNPSLGYLDEALGFIAAERARFTAMRESGHVASARAGSSQASTSENAWRHVIEPRRKRRRKRGKHGNGGSASSRQDPANEVENEPDNDVDGEQGSSSELENELGVDTTSSNSKSAASLGKGKGKSVPATPLPARLRKQRAQAQRQLLADPNTNVPTPPKPMKKLSHSKSTPSLRVAIPVQDPHVLRLRTLATKLRMLFSEDARHLSVILNIPNPDTLSFVCPTKRTQDSPEVLTHVFIDHSNILIGFLNFLRRFPPHGSSKRAKTHIWHAALALILERGRPISRRVLVTSSPLYQPMDDAERLGYEVRVYARVPDTGDGIDRSPRFDKDDSQSPARKIIVGHSRKRSGALVSPTSTTESDQVNFRGLVGPANLNGHSSSSQNVSATKALPIPVGKRSSHSRSRLSPHSPTTSNGGNVSSSGSAGGRIRYREQGVDELLQLKLHQAIASTDAVIPGSTIVLATGDGNVGQFNEEGFLGCVRTALKKGWRVELYAWEVGLSKAWVKEFGGESWEGRFRVIGLERFSTDLLEM